VLARGEFVAFDCEMTGLYLAGQEDYAVDDIEDRYLKAAAAAEAFTVTQLGLSVWAWDDAAGCFEATSFNFTLFPAAAPPEHDTRFLCQASSLAFLASQGFDFNRVRWVLCKDTAAGTPSLLVCLWLCGCVGQLCPRQV
jgi:poly(A)-specific ribonuclease